MVTLRADVDNIVISIVFTYNETITPSNGSYILSYLSISTSLNVLLTLMIVIRLILHTRNIRNAMGIGGIGGLCKAISTMLIESCALYAVTSLLVIIPLAIQNYAMDIFFPILAETQVRAFLYHPRSSDRSADVTTDWTGHRFTTHHSASCQQECNDE